jgi:Leucine-rich repeat (LRR) protein
LARLRNLRSLDLSGTGINDVAPLAALTGLQYLDLGTTPIVDLAPLATLAELRWLILYGTTADTSVLSHLTRCQIITKPMLPRRRRSLPRN